MLCIKHLAPHRFHRIRRQLLSFTIKYGDRRITREATEWLANAHENELEKPGSAILLATHTNRLVGIFAAVDYGRSISFAVVSTLDRGQGIGERLIREFIDWAGQFTCRVNANNYPSLRTCMKAGLVIDQLWKGKRDQIIFRLVTPNLLQAADLHSLQMPHPIVKKPDPSLASPELDSQHGLKRQQITTISQINNRQVLLDENAQVGNYDPLLEQS